MTSEIAVRAEIVRADSYEPRGIEDAWNLAETLHRSGLLPRGLARPEAVLYALIAGREIGLTATQSLRSLHIVEGKVVLSADLIVAMAKRNKSVCRYFRLVESTGLVARYETQRVDEPAPTSMSWTWDQAQRAGLTGKDNWRKYADAMLRARCAAALARAVYPDLCMGMYDPDELDDVERRPARRAAPQPAPAPVETAHDADAADATTLDKVRDDVRANGGSDLSLEQAIAIVETHWSALVTDGDDALDAAADIVKQSLALGLITKFHAAWNERIRKLAEERRATHEAARAAAEPMDWRAEALADIDGEQGDVAALKSSLRAAQDCDAVLARYAEARDSLAKLTDDGDKAAARAAVVARWAQVTNTTERESAQKSLRAKLPKPDGSDPKGGRKRNTPAADAQGAANESGEATGPQARAALPESAEYAASASAWEAHCASWNSPYAVENGWAKHQPSFDAAGVREARLRVAAARLANLRHCDEDVARKRLLTVEADALRAAQTPTIASRRAKRDRDERMGPRTLADMVMPRAAGWR
jgi:hypothetical protein